MHRDRLRVGRAGQRFAQRQLQGRETFEAHLLGEFHHARLADARFTRQLLRAEVPGLVRLGEDKISQLFIACRQRGIALANAD